MNDEENCMCLFKKIKKGKDENGNKILKCKKCNKLIFVGGKDFNFEKILGITGTGL